MKITFILLAVAAVAVIAFLTECKKQGVQADVDAAVAQGQYQFIALLDPAGKWTYPQVPGIPGWYFHTTGIRMVMTKPETKDADLAYMKSYNDALYQTLKAQGKFQMIEENVARVKANLDKYNQSLSKTASSTNESPPTPQKQ
jgi:hypothetical protein